MDAPSPLRPLAVQGRLLWDRLWSPTVDVDLLLVTCEQIDERQALRVRVLRDNDPSERAGLRALDKAIQAGLTALGGSPVSAVAASGRLATLEAVRDRLAGDLDAASPQVAAQLAAQLRATLAEIAELTVGEGGSWSDELALRRTTRDTGAVVPAAAKRISKRQA